MLGKLTASALTLCLAAGFAASASAGAPAD